MANEDAFSVLADEVISQLSESSSIRFRRPNVAGSYSASAGAYTGGGPVTSTGVSAVRRGGEPDLILRGAGEGQVRTEIVEYLFKQSDLAAAWALGEVIEQDVVLDDNDNIQGQVIEVRREVHLTMRRVFVQRLPAVERVET